MHGHWAAVYTIPDTVKQGTNATIEILQVPIILVSVEYLQVILEYHPILYL